MKHFKKFLAFAVAVIMVIAMAMPVFAGSGEEGGETPAATTKTITLTGGKAGHTYTLYQIFTGKVENGELTNIQWGSDAPASLKTEYDTAAAAAAAIATQNDARAFAQEYASSLTGGTANELTADGNVEFSGLSEGYYVIVDTITGTVAETGDYSSAYIVKVVEDVSGKIKGSPASSDKSVEDASGNDGEAAAYSVGDAVPFTLTATTADNVAAYKQYHITFQDKQSAGLDAPTAFTVTVLGLTFDIPATEAHPATQTTANGTKITVSQVDPASGNTFAINVEFEQANPTKKDGKIISYLNSECDSKVITVNYTATLKSSAVVGLPGNTNDMHIEYSNNPEDEDGGDEGKTQDDTVKVFTYKTVLDKVDADGNALEGAGFTIYREVTVKEGETAPTGAVLGSEITFADGVEHSAIVATKYYIPCAMTTVSGNDAQFEFEGLADGTYVLVETTVPAGFNAFKSVEFTISSAVTETEITTLTGTTPFTTTNPGADGAVTSGDHALDSGELYAEIENNSGQTLPETGGIGRTIFYVLGSILVLGAAVVLIARNRAKAH